MTMTVDGVTRTVAVQGEIDVGNGHLLVELGEHVCAAGARQVRLDLSQVTFFGAYGVNVVLRLHHLLAACGGELVLVDPSPCVHRILRLVGVAGHLHTAVGTASD